MTDIGHILARLGIDQYLDAFVEEGFDTWETLLDITESDLDALNVKLGHRRKIQREIANYRGVAYERSLDSPAHEAASDSSKAGDTDVTLIRASGEKKASSGTEGKRKYRRHPKPDENAPERPPSAYVIFSNKVREDVKSQNLSFTEIAKLVGEHWQMRTPAEKEPFEAQATAAKERYNTELAQYKRTESYRNYMQYLTDFKSKHGSLATEGKRPKLEKESSNVSSASSIKPAESSESLTPMPRHNRGTSVGSGSFPSNLSSPISTVPSSLSHAPGQATTLGHRNSPGTDLPSQFLPPRSGIFSVPVASRPPPAGGNNSERETRNIQVPQGALTAEGYQDYAPISALEPLPLAQPSRPPMLPPTFLREETTASYSSMSSSLSSRSTSSSVPGILYTPGSTPSAHGFPHTPTDDLWARRPTVTPGSLPPPESYKGDYLQPRPSGNYYPRLPPPQLANRGNEASSPTVESQRIDTYLRSLPPPTSGPPNSIPQYEPNRRRSLRSHVSDPGGVGLQPTSQADEVRISLPSAHFTDPDDPLSVLAHAGEMVDEERRDPPSSRP